MDRFVPSILVVEDEVLIALDIQMQLEDEGWCVIGPASNVAQAEGLLTNTRPGFALLDINLGRQTSYAIADRLERDDIPFVFLSGSTDDQLPERFRDHPLLPKPIKFDDLMGILRIHCG